MVVTLRHINTGFKRIPKNYLFKNVGRATTEVKVRLEGEGKPDDIIKIGIGDPDIQTPTQITETIQREEGVYRGYPEYEGIPELRAAVSNYYKERFGVDVSPKNIIIGDGAKSDLSHMPLAFANRGNKTALQDPAYPVYLNWSRFFGLNVFPMQCTPENNFFGQIPKQALDNQLALIWVCSPNNPTGALAKKGELEKIVQEARDVGAVVVHDIAYADFRPGEKPPYAPSIFNITGAEDVAIEVNSASKPFSMTKNRVGYVAILNPKLLEVWGNLRTNFDSGVPESIQHGYVTALTHPGVRQQVKENMKIYGERATILRKGFESMGCKVYGLEHAPYGWIGAPRGYSDEDFSRRMLNEAHVVSVWGSGFGECGKGFSRVTVFQKTEKIREAMERVNGIKW